MNNKSNSFTMAEILISLTIVGVISAIVIPAVVGNINEKVFTNQRKAFYSRMSQAIELMPNLNGFGKYTGTWVSNNNVTVTEDTAAEGFITNGLSKVLDINNICTVDKDATADAARKEIKKCGIPSKYTKWDGTANNDFPTKLSEINNIITSEYPDGASDKLANPVKNIDTRVGAFTTKNGESVAVFYNPYCVDRDIIFNASVVPDNPYYKNAKSFFPYFCASFIYDLNGLKGPNKFGKDIWVMSALYATNKEMITIAPDKILGYKGNKYNDAVTHCAQQKARIPTLNEALALSFFRPTSGISGGYWVLGKAELGQNYAPHIYSNKLVVSEYMKSRPGWGATCIKR